MKGRIFSVEEFSTFDGPGIRATVFLKGCPLRCTWCHNPEGQRFETEYLRRQGNCLSCGACLRASDTREDGSRFLTARSAEVCPRLLIRPVGEEIEAEQLCERLLSLASILSAAGGGVTFSGGEPLGQSEFLLACASILEGKLHRALQTCGAVSSTVFEEAISHFDYVLYDLKLIDPVMHLQYCGADNRNVLENYRTLVASGIPFITRVPLIPRVVDTEENLRAIAEWMKDCGANEVELLPYNQMAGGKYASLLRAYEPCFDESIPFEPRLEIFEKYGIHARVL